MLEIFNLQIPPLTMQVAGGALLIFCLRIIDVSLLTVRMILVFRGHRLWSAVISFVAMMIWVVAISTVLTNLNNVWNIVGYSGGFAAGTLVGMWLEKKLALGYENVLIVSAEKGKEITQKVRAAGYGATELMANGRSGPVSLISMVIPRKNVAETLRLVSEADKDSFITVEEARHVTRGYNLHPH